MRSDSYQTYVDRHGFDEHLISHGGMPCRLRSNSVEDPRGKLFCRYHANTRLELVETRPECRKWMELVPPCMIYRCPVRLGNGRRCPWIHAVRGSFTRRACSICGEVVLPKDAADDHGSQHASCRHKQTDKRTAAFAAVQQRRAGR